MCGWVGSYMGGCRDVDGWMDVSPEGGQIDVWMNGQEWMDVGGVRGVAGKMDRCK